MNHEVRGENLEGTTLGKFCFFTFSLRNGAVISLLNVAPNLSMISNGLERIRKGEVGAHLRCFPDIRLE